jgi:hypothetical protein
MAVSFNARSNGGRKSVGSFNTLGLVSFRGAGVPIAEFATMGAEVVQRDNQPLCFAVEHRLDGIGVYALHVRHRILWGYSVIEKFLELTRAVAFQLILQHGEVLT